MKEFSREYLERAIEVFDSSGAPRTEDLLMVLEDEFSLTALEASWLYDAIVCARPVLGELKSIRVVRAEGFSGAISGGTRHYGDYVYIVVR